MAIDLLRVLSSFADMNLTASWGWAMDPIPTPIRSVVTTVIHMGVPNVGISFHPFIPLAMMLSKVPSATLISQSCPRLLKASVTPPSCQNVNTRMNTIPTNMIPACRASLYMTAMTPPNVTYIATMRERPRRATFLSRPMVTAMRLTPPMRTAAQ